MIGGHRQPQSPGLRSGPALGPVFVAEYRLLLRSVCTVGRLIAIGLLGATLFEALLSGIRSWVFAHTSSKIDVELGARLFRHLLALPLAYFQARRVGDSVARVRELESIRSFLTGNVLTLVMDLLLGVVAAPVLVWMLAAGLKEFDLAVLMARWMFPYIGFMSLVALSAGILNTWKRFAVPAATPVLLTVSVIAAAWLGAPWLEKQGIEAIYALPAGVMLGGVLQLGVQIPALRRLGLLPRLGLSVRAIRAAWGNEATRRILRLMAPALLGVGVAQISLLINTQIASHLAAGSVSWLSYADRLMEFPTAMLGVALGVVLMPQLAAAKATGDADRYAEMLDWGLRLVVLLAVPCAAALLVFAQPLVAVLYHYGAFTDRDVQQTTLSLTGYGVGLLGLVAIKVLAPGYYASQDIRTPVKIAVVVLVITQLFNLVFVPWLQHAGLALSIGLGATVNALWLLAGLLRRGSYRPQPGWRVFALRVLLATAVLTGLLWWATQQLQWVGLRTQPWLRIGYMLAVLLASAMLYFGALWAMGLRLKAFLKR